MSSEDSGVNGILLVDKSGFDANNLVTPPYPAASSIDPRSYPTSHDVVQQVRRLSKQRRIGHTGTLDPMASGLLVLCLGWATRLVEYYQGHAKSYRAEITLGYATDTYDALGTVTERLPVPALSASRIEAALAQMRGSVFQTPPVYSALKQGGESLHYKARRGEEVTVQPRAVTFHEITLLDFVAPDRIVLDIRCSAGAYIRSLAFDVGRTLDTAATLTALRRTSAGPFAVSEAHTMAQVEAAATAASLTALLLPPGARLDLPTLTATEPVLARLGHGQVVQFTDLCEVSPQNQNVTSLHSSHALLQDGVVGAQQVAQVRSNSGLLVGVVRRVTSTAAAETTAGWRADKWFA